MKKREGKMSSKTMWIAMLGRYANRAAKQFKNGRPSKETFASLIAHLQLGWSLATEEKLRRVSVDGRRETVSSDLSAGGPFLNFPNLPPDLPNDAWWAQDDRHRVFALHAARLVKYKEKAAMEEIMKGRLVGLFESVRKKCVQNKTVINPIFLPSTGGSMEADTFADSVCSLIGSNPANLEEDGLDNPKWPNNLSALLADLESALGVGNSAWRPTIMKPNVVGSPPSDGTPEKVRKVSTRKRG